MKDRETCLIRVTGEQAKMLRTAVQSHIHVEENCDPEFQDLEDMLDDLDPESENDFTA